MMSSSLPKSVERNSPNSARSNQRAESKRVKKRLSSRNALSKMFRLDRVVQNTFVLSFKERIYAKLFERSMLHNLLQDLRYGLRMLRKNPGFTFVAALVLALGIGANTAIFSIVDVVLFRPLPVSDSNELVRIFGGETRGNASWGYLSLPEYQEYRDRTSAFSGLAAYVDRFPANVSAGKFGTERVDAGMVTGNYFQLLRTNPEFGRNLLPDDDKKGAAPVAMLGYQFWKRHFPSDATVLGS